MTFSSSNTTHLFFQSDKEKHRFQNSAVWRAIWRSNFRVIGMRETIMYDVLPLWRSRPQIPRIYSSKVIKRNIVFRTLRFGERFGEDAVSVIALDHVVCVDSRQKQRVWVELWWKLLKQFKRVSSKVGVLLVNPCDLRTVFLSLS